MKKLLLVFSIIGFIGFIGLAFAFSPSNSVQANDNTKIICEDSTKTKKCEKKKKCCKTKKACCKSKAKDNK